MKELVNTEWTETISVLVDALNRHLLLDKKLEVLYTSDSLLIRYGGGAVKFSPTGEVLGASNRPIK